MGTEEPGKAASGTLELSLTQDCPHDPKCGPDRDPCVCHFCEGNMYQRGAMAGANGDVFECVCPDCGATCVAEFEGSEPMRNWSKGESAL